MLTPTQVENLIRFLINEIVKLIEGIDIELDANKQRLLLGIDELFHDLDIGLADHIPETLLKRYIEGIQQAENDLEGFGMSVGKNADTDPNRVVRAPQHKEAITNIVTDTMTDLAAATRTAKVYANRNVDKAISDVKNELATGMISGMDTKSISKRVAQKFADQNMTAFVTVDGKHLPLDFYAKTVTRTKMRTANNHGTLNRYKDRKVKHVYVTGNIPTCGECARYRGIVFATERGDTFPYINLYTTFPLHPNCECNFRPWIMKFKSKQEIDQAKDKAKTFNPEVDPRTQKERDKYKDEQKRRQLARRKQMSYNKMKSKLGKEGPQSYAEYTNAFNNNKPLYHSWVAKMKDLSKGNENVIINTQDNLINELTDHTIEWASKLNEDQLQDIAKYGMHDYKIIHKYIDDNSTGKNLRYSQKIETKINNIYQALSLYNFDKPLTLYRGINRSEYLELKSNNKLKIFKSFKSTSIAEDIAQEFQADHRYGCMVILHVPPYVNGGFIAPIVDLPDEKEFLLNLGTEYKVIKEYNKNGMKYLEIEVKSYDN
ncbi:phage minor capsid protein [Mammaliicoccus sciuri]|uniref:phage minor capsid protein n=1 Tax=Mammaliicoccus sciuri TaxID=1296 RepID=UPI000CD2821D|nr:phage minor capsid protein [Mammaliicoccus sciuri]PNZ29982.1 capsid protein [Mammaliicoccus sciuri]